MAKTQFTPKKALTFREAYPRRARRAFCRILLLFSVVNVAQKYIGLRRQIRQLSAQQKTLTAKQDLLNKTNAYLETPEGTEQALREKYNVVKPGEGIIVVSGADTTATADVPSKVARWWNAIIAGLGFHKK